MLNNNKEEISKIKDAVIVTLHYFGLFKYPLTIEEIHRFLSLKVEYEQLGTYVEELLEVESIHFSNEGYYSIKNNPEWSKERLAGNRRAEDLLIASKKYVRRISRFPFVSSIAISGSLSKYYADEDADIDYFIITNTNRLWISRTLLHFYKKLTFIGGNEHYYCMNYFIDESALEIDQKNIYAAIETVTLIPVYNKNMIHSLKQKNLWVRNFLPNEDFKEDIRYIISPRKQYIKSFIESLINILNPKGLNKYLMNVTDSKWRKKWRKKSYPMENYDQAFYTTINISKNHPDNYQRQILSAIDTKDSITPQSTCSL